MNTCPVHFIGIDVAKDTLEISAQGLSLPASIANTSKSIARLLKALEKLIELAVHQDPLLSGKVSRLTQAKGVGFLTAVTLLASMPELGSLTRNAASALAGVAPFNRDSGFLRGKRFIQAGRPKARRALYMAALVASRYNPILSKFYQHLISKGKPPKLALTALMRKLIGFLNSLLKFPSLQIL